MPVIDFYDRHPISEGQVLDAVRRVRGSSSPGEGSAEALTADDLYPFDQDHYGGLGAVDALARRAGITAASRVLEDRKHTSELQSPYDLVCRLLLEKKNAHQRRKSYQLAAAVKTRCRYSHKQTT